MRSVFPNDISTSVDEGASVGTDLSKLLDHPRRTVSQIKLKDNNEYKIKFPSGYNSIFCHVRHAFESHFIHFYGGRYILGGAFTDIGYFTAITMCYF